MTCNQWENDILYVNCHSLCEYECLKSNLEIQVLFLVIKQTENRDGDTVLIHQTHRKFLANIFINITICSKVSKYSADSKKKLFQHHDRTLRIFSWVTENFVSYCALLNITILNQILRILCHMDLIFLDTGQNKF